MLACLIAALLASTVAMVSAARTIEIGPKVGDILVFPQGARMPPDSSNARERRPRSKCTGRAGVPAMLAKIVATTRSLSCPERTFSCWYLGLSAQIPSYIEHLFGQLDGMGPRDRCLHIPPRR